MAIPRSTRRLNDTESFKDTYIYRAFSDDNGDTFHSIARGWYFRFPDGLENLTIYRYTSDFWDVSATYTTFSLLEDDDTVSDFGNKSH